MKKKKFGRKIRIFSRAEEKNSILIKKNKNKKKSV